MRKSALPFSLIAFSLLGYYIYRNSAELSSSLELNPRWFCLLFLLTVARFYLNSSINQIALAELGAKLGRWESFSLTSVGSAMQMFLPLNGGAVFRAIYLKRRYQLAYAHFLSTQLGIQIVGLLFTCLAAIASLALVANLHESAILGGMALCVACFCASMIAFFLPKFKRRNHRLWDKLAMLSEGCHRLRTNRPLLLKMVLISISKTLADALIFWCGSNAIGLNISLLGATALTAVAALAACFRLTPGALGTYEALVGLVSQAALLTSAQAVTVSLVVRGASYLLVAFLFPLCSWWLVTHRGLHWHLRETPNLDSSPATDVVSRAA